MTDFCWHMEFGCSMFGYLLMKPYATSWIYIQKFSLYILGMSMINRIQISLPVNRYFIEMFVFLKYFFQNKSFMSDLMIMLF
jgi:hypothetical protein